MATARVPSLKAKPTDYNDCITQYKLIYAPQ